MQVVEADDRSLRPGQGGDDEAPPRNEPPELMLDGDSNVAVVVTLT